MRIDLNGDLGEGAGNDADLLALVTSANIACARHAGTPTDSVQALVGAARHGVRVGAHPGHPDPEHFGRRELTVTPEDVFRECVYQVGALVALATLGGCEHGSSFLLPSPPALRGRGAGGEGDSLPAQEKAMDSPSQVRPLTPNPSPPKTGARGTEENPRPKTRSHYHLTLTHLKPHGGLYHQACRDEAIARAVVDTAVMFGLAVVGLPGSRLASACEGRTRFVAEGFADRRYAADGSLVPRGRPDALIHDVDEAVRQVERLLEGGVVETVCVHGDGASAVAFARALRQALAERGHEVRAFAD